MTTDERMNPIILLGIVFHCLGCCFFYSGFLPSKSSVTETVPLPSTNISTLNLTRKYDRLIFMVIDALRSDFALGKENRWSGNMPFLKALISNNKTYSFHSKADLPTVTMPRLKTITTGSASDFNDIFSNAASNELTSDNIIKQFSLHDLKIVFYGDDTWVKLFPRTFLRSDGTHSFYVSDYTEVDDNVTRHLDSELQNTDWDVMILHYLGLDHIGHLAGPFSPLIGPKLQEMDGIIKRLVEKIEASLKETRTLLVITGDHGMSNAGSHGGSTSPEIFSPLIFIDGFSGAPFDDITVNQVDIASTLALLFGMPIPSQSIGYPVQALFSEHSYKDLRVFKQKVACQLLSLSGDVSNKTLVEGVSEVCNGRNPDFGSTLNQMLSEALQAACPEFSMFKMILGLSCMFLNLLLVLSVFSKLLTSNGVFQTTYTLHSKLLGTFQILGAFLVLISMFSTSFIEEEQYVWYYLVPSYFVLNLLICKSGLKDTLTLLLLLRLALSWRRTGIKWIDLADLHDWFTLGENRNLLLCLVTICLITSFMLRYYYESSTGKVILSTAYLNIIAYQFAMSYSHPNHLPLARLAYVQICLLAVFKFKALITSWKTMFLPLGLFLMKLENIPWLVAVLLLENLLTRKLLPLYASNTKLQLGEWQVCGIFIALSKFTHFSQGNSNGFATVDLAPGMIGLREYHLILSNVVIFIATYYSQLFWMCSFLDYRNSPAEEVLHISPNSKSGVTLVILPVLYQSLIGTWLCIIIFVQRFHLFIWSVFAPRFFYMLASTFVCMSLATVALVKETFLSLFIVNEEGLVTLINLDAHHRMSMFRID